MAEHKSHRFSIIFLIVCTLTIINLGLGFRASKNINQDLYGFTDYVTPDVTLDYPQPGDVTSGVIRIRWDTEGIDLDNLNYEVKYSSDGGELWDAILPGTTGFPKKSSDDHWVYWDTTTVPDGSYQIQIRCDDGVVEAYDILNGFFVIDNSKTFLSTGSPDNHPPKVVIEYPWRDKIRRTIPIIWHGYDEEGAILTYNVSYSPDLGITWVPLTIGLTNVSDSTSMIYWDTLGVPDGSSYVIRVIYSDGTWIGTEVTDKPFIINNHNNEEPELDLYGIENNDTVSGSLKIQIRTRDDDGDALLVNISYSSDEGQTWMPIKSNIPISSNQEWLEHEWNTTSLPNGFYMLRVTSFDGLEEKSISKTLEINNPVTKSIFTKQIESVQLSIKQPETELSAKELTTARVTTDILKKTYSSSLKPLTTEQKSNSINSIQETEQDSFVEVILVKWDLRPDQKGYIKLKTILNGTEVPSAEFLAAVQVEILHGFEGSAKLESGSSNTYTFRVTDWTVPTQLDHDAIIIVSDIFGDQHKITHQFSFVHWRTYATSASFVVILITYYWKKYLKPLT